MNSVDRFIHDLKSSVPMTHKALSDKIDTVTNMTGLYVYMNILINQFVATNCCSMVFPVGFPDIVLLKLISRQWERFSEVRRDSLPSSEADGRQKRSSELEQSWGGQKTSFLRKYAAPCTVGSEILLIAISAEKYPSTPNAKEIPNRTVYAFNPVLAFTFWGCFSSSLPLLSAE
ncbi:hypothetical protein ACMFMG_012154 [Clarireedia jacksonii]